MADYIDDDFVREKDITQKSKIIRKRTAKEVSSSKYTLSSKDLDLDLDSSSDKLHSTPLKQKIMLQIEPIQDDEDMYGDVDEEEDEDSAEKSRDSYKTAQCNDHLVDKSYETDGDQQGDAKDDDDQLYRSSSTQIRDANVDHGTGLEQHLEAGQLEALHRQQRKIFSRLDSLDKRVARMEVDIKSLAPAKAKGRLTWPIDSIDTLQNYEARLRSKEVGLENSLKQQLGRARQTSLEIFIRENLKHMLGATGRWTWTGQPPNSSKADAPVSQKASELLIVQVLIDFCEELFKENTATVIGEIKRAFKKINEAKKKFDQRHNESCI